MFSSFSQSFVLLGVHALLMLFVFINVYWCPTRSTCEMMVMPFNSIMTCVTCGAGVVNPSRAPEFTPVFLVGFVLLHL